MTTDDPARLPDDRIQAIRSAIFRGRKIDAIKLYREATALGLAEAKAFIEALELRLRQDEPDQFTIEPGKAGCAGVLWLMGTTTAAAAQWLL